MKKLFILLLCVILVYLLLRLLNIQLIPEFSFHKLGCIEGNCENGYGTYIQERTNVLKDKLVYEKYVGEFKNGLKNGTGTHTFFLSSIAASDGSFKYVGEWQNGKYHGQGTYTIKGSTTYVGEFKNGEYDGEGTLFREGETSYVGRFKNGKWLGTCDQGDCVNGYGTYILGWGEQYIGEWKDGQYHGKGTYTWASGDQYIGEYKNGQYHGKGTLTKESRYKVVDDGSKYVGEWKDGNKNGEGTLTNSKGIYVGEWKDDKFHGKGTLKYKGHEKKDEESGNWKDGKLHGYGIRIWLKKHDQTHQSKYIGNFRDDMRDGYGTEWYNWGDYFKGNFDCCSGIRPTQEGTMYYLDGTSKYGTWETETVIYYK